jgi:hypothetical protein
LVFAVLARQKNGTAMMTSLAPGCRLTCRENGAGRIGHATLVVEPRGELGSTVIVPMN